MPAPQLVSYRSLGRALFGRGPLDRDVESHIAQPSCAEVAYTQFTQRICASLAVINPIRVRKAYYFDH